MTRLRPTFSNAPLVGRRRERGRSGRTSIVLVAAVVAIGAVIAAVFYWEGERGDAAGPTRHSAEEEQPEPEVELASADAAPVRTDVAAEVDSGPEPEPGLGIAEPAPEPEAPTQAIPAGTDITAARVHGILIDQHDRLVPHHPVVLATRERGSPGDLLKLSSRRGEVARTTTDAAGRFAFEGVAPGSFLLGPLAAGSRRIEQPDGSILLKPLELRVAPVATGVDVPAGADEVFVELRAPSGLSIRGRVEFEDGTPASGARVEAWVVEHRGLVRNHADANGEFEIEPLAEGAYALYAEFDAIEPAGSGGPYAAARAQEPEPAAGKPNAATWTPLRANAGDEGIVLVVTAGGGFDGRVIDAATGEPAKAMVYVQPAPTSTDAAISVFVPTRADGAFGVDDMAPTLYDLYVFDGESESGGRVGVAFDVQAVGGEDRPNVTIEIAPGATLDVLYEGPASEARVDVLDARGRRVCEIPTLPGSSVPWQVPAGTLTLEFSERGGPGRAWTTEVEAVAGAAPLPVRWSPDGEGAEDPGAEVDPTTDG